MEYHLSVIIHKRVAAPNLRTSSLADQGDALADRLRRQIGEWIFNGQVLPGQRLDERGLAEKLSVSRTPVREALRQLQAAGLVDIVPNRGAVVATVDLHRLAELFEVVAEFESVCARLATSRMTPIEKGSIREILADEQSAAHAGDIEAFAIANRRLHTAIVAGAHNKSLEEAVSNYRTRTAPFRKAQLALPDRLKVTAADDARVIELIMAGDGAAVAAAVKRHLEATAFHASKCILITTPTPTPTPTKAKRRQR